mgnify:CR=1 FL=1
MRAAPPELVRRRGGRAAGAAAACRTAFAGATTGQQLLYALDEQVRPEVGVGVGLGLGRRALQTRFGAITRFYVAAGVFLLAGIVTMLQLLFPIFTQMVVDQVIVEFE